jgi:hypothetical protein
MVQPNNGGCGIATPATKTGSHRNALTQINIEPDRVLGVRQHHGSGAIDKITLVCRQLRCITAKLNILSVGTQLDLHLIFESNRLHDRPEIVESVGATVEDTQDHVDFGRSEDGDLGGTWLRINRGLP